MSQIKRLAQKIVAEHELLAMELKKRFEKEGLFVINIMASPGAGKTSLIIETIKHMKERHNIGVIEGDVVKIDVERVEKLGVPVVLANTGGSCHLDSLMVHKALEYLDLPSLDILIIENVGNLICPMGFPLGADINVVIASVPEGDDKPLKYPNMFAGADVVLLNKFDYAPLADFDVSRFKQGLERVNPQATLMTVSCKTGEGINVWIDWLIESQMA